jgi:hypothetical protein
VHLLRWRLISVLDTVGISTTPFVQVTVKKHVANWQNLAKGRKVRNNMAMGNSLTFEIRTLSTVELLSYNPLLNSKVK